MRLLLIFCTLTSLTGLSQNLLMNGSFEDENICTEYIKNCSPEGWISTSLWSDYYFDDAPKAYDGKHFAGLVLASANKPRSHNFLRSRLLCGLRKDARYLLEFYIRSAHPVLDSVGILFSENDLLFQKEQILSGKPQILLALDGKIIASTEWQKITIEYTAAGIENYIIIGDFRSRGYECKTEKPDLAKDFYFFIDKVSLSPTNSAEHLCREAATVKDEEYAFDARHTVLEKYLAQYKKDPPPPKKFAKTIVQKIDTLTIPDVLFATNSASLSEDARTSIAEFFNAVGSLHVDSVVVNGHTDNTGTEGKNRELALGRARAVVTFLYSFLPSTPYFSYGYGSETPVADNRRREGRQRNRRVEVLVFSKN